MDPLTPNDPLWKALGKGREPEVRPNFVQHVLREARQTPQERGWLSRVRAWWEESAAPLPAGGLMATAAAVVVAGWFILPRLETPVEGPAVAEAPAQEAVDATSAAPSLKEVQVAVIEEVPEVEAQLESLDHLDALLAHEDTTSFSDQEIAFLLY